MIPLNFSPADRRAFARGRRLRTAVAALVLAHICGLALWSDSVAIGAQHISGTELAVVMFALTAGNLISPNMPSWEAVPQRRLSTLAAITCAAAIAAAASIPVGGYLLVQNLPGALVRRSDVIDLADYRISHAAVNTLNAVIVMASSLT